MCAENSEGATPLHDAVLRGDVAIVQELLTHGAAVIIQTQAKPGWVITQEYPKNQIILMM